MKAAKLLRKLRGVNPGTLLLINDKVNGYGLAVLSSVTEEGARLETTWGVSAEANYIVAAASTHVSNLISVKVLNNPKQ